MDKWVRQLKNKRNGVTSNATPLTPNQCKIRELEKRINRIEMEKEILKTTTALLMSDTINVAEKNYWAEYKTVAKIT